MSILYKDSNGDIKDIASPVNNETIQEIKSELDELETPVLSSPTKTSAYTSGNIVVCRIGNIVQVTVTELKASIGTNNADSAVATGLPKAAQMSISRIFNADGKELRLLISTGDTKLQISGGDAVNGWGTLTYIAQE